MANIFPGKSVGEISESSLHCVLAKGWMTVSATVLTKKTVSNLWPLSEVDNCDIWGRICASLLMCKNHIKGVKGYITYIYTHVVYINIYNVYMIYIYDIWFIIWDPDQLVGISFINRSQVMQKICRLQPPERGDASTQCSPQHGCLCSSTRLVVKEGWTPRCGFGLF